VVKELGSGGELSTSDTIFNPLLKRNGIDTEYVLTAARTSTSLDLQVFS
jgi:hypothetical protein